ncbi:MAG TPA: DUF192 domain-containing protein [Elusimicrobiota bacterium]|nr:DUF192 domain-containing protein [Elusimicrobiota bacterium]
MIAVHASTGRTLASRVAKADDAGSRSKGLLGRESLGADEGLWIVQPSLARLVPCPTIHTFFMKFPIDVLFLDASLQVRRVIEDMKPWRLSPWVAAADSILELKGGTLRGSVRAGDRLEMRAA